MSALFVRVAIAAAVFFVGLNASAAAVVTVTPAGVAYSYSVGGAIVPGNVDFQSMDANAGRYQTETFAQGTLHMRNAEIVTGNDKSGFFQHIKPAGVSNNEHYLSVFGPAPFTRAGSAVFSFNTLVTTFAFTWGSIDRYNWLEVTNADNDTYKISGNDLISNVAGIVAGKTSKYFSLTDLSGILRVVLHSCRDSFEIADVSVSAVPLPAALPLFGLGLAALASARARRKNDNA